ncbi:hypothetical protein OF377_03265, partial [Ureaplasma sp. ES3154-GEN]|uniref:hypothetical protein n=1 Tax=Ureaplasma sp. ES3154-GEN TaxID=2984844 RepID=UPI0021E897A2
QDSTFFLRDRTAQGSEYPRHKYHFNDMWWNEYMITKRALEFLLKKLIKDNKKYFKQYFQFQYQ